jgi:hypothetical protein
VRSQTNTPQSLLTSRQDRKPLGDFPSYFDDRLSFDTMAESALRSDRRRLHSLVALGAAAILLAATTNVLLRRNARAYVERALDIAEAHPRNRRVTNSP